MPPNIPKQPLPSGSPDLSAVTHDSPETQRVFGLSSTLTAAGAVTASITSGSPYFKISKFNCYNVEWKTQTTGGGGGELPPGRQPSPIIVTEVPVLTLSSSSNGVTPLQVQIGQWIALDVTADVPLGSGLLPGPFTGSAVITGGGLNITVPLKCTYLGVNPNSAIGKAWQQLGGEAKLGAVLTNEATAPDGSGIVQTFANGALYQVPGIARAGTQNVFYFTTAIYQKWLSLANAKDVNGALIWSVLGKPTENTFQTADGGQALRFQDGVIVVRKNAKAFVVYGAIYSHYTELGDLKNPSQQPSVGLPNSDEGPVDPLDAGDGQRVSHFDNGDIYWSRTTGAWELNGLILQHWISINGSGGDLGLPTTDETGAPDGFGRYNLFQKGGAIYWSPSTGAHALLGPISTRWNSLGGVNSYLGYPTSDIGPWVEPLTRLPGTICSFQFGHIGLLNNGTVIELPAVVTQTVSASTQADVGSMSYSVTAALQSDGTYSITYHLDNEGELGYDYQVAVSITASGGIWLGATHSGSLAGKISTSGSRTTDFTDTGKHSWISAAWKQGAFQSIAISVHLIGSANGVVGFLADQAKILVESLAATAIAGPVAGAMVLLGAEAASANLGFSGTIGIISGVAVLALTGGAVLLAVAAGVTAGAVAATLIKQRTMSSDELALVNNVFHNTLPPANQIILTNLNGLNGCAFTVPGVDGKIYVNLGPGYDNPTRFIPPLGDYPTPGEVFIHELTHVWQIHNNPNLPFYFCEVAVARVQNATGIDVYSYGPPDTPWNLFNPEAQGAVVDKWFGGVNPDGSPYATSRTSTAGKDTSSPTFGVNDPYFHYIKDNIRAGKD